MLVMQTQTETPFHLVKNHRNNHRNITKITKPLHHIQHCLLLQSLHYLFSSDSIFSPASLWIDPTWMCQSTVQLLIINNSKQVKVTVILQSIASYSISMLSFFASPIAPQTVKGPFSVTISVEPPKHNSNIK